MQRLHAVIGDVHGCLGPLRRLEDRIVRHASKEGLEPFFVLVGDLIDRGPDSAGVVRHLRRGVAAGTHAVCFGNHEQLMLAAIQAHAPHLLEAAGCALPAAVVPYGSSWEKKESVAAKWFPRDVFDRFNTLMWLTQGGAPTLASYGTGEPTDPATWRFDEEDLAFLTRLPLVWRSESVVVTHALASREDLDTIETIDPPVAIAEDSAVAGEAAAYDGFGALARVIPGDDSVAIAASDRDRWRRAVHRVLWGRTFPDLRPDAVRTHASGHTPVRVVKRVRPLGLVLVDTGAFAGRRLSSWCAETDHVLSVSSDIP